MAEEKTKYVRGIISINKNTENPTFYSAKRTEIQFNGDLYVLKKGLPLNMDELRNHYKDLTEQFKPGKNIAARIPYEQYQTLGQIFIADRIAKGKTSEIEKVTLETQVLSDSDIARQISDELDRQAEKD